MKFDTLDALLAHDNRLCGVPQQAAYEVQRIMLYGQACMGGSSTQEAFYFDESNDDGYSIALWPAAPIDTILLDPRHRPQHMRVWREDVVVVTPQATLVTYYRQTGGPRLQLLLYMAPMKPATARAARRPAGTSWERLMAPWADE